MKIICQRSCSGIKIKCIPEVYNEVWSQGKCVREPEPSASCTSIGNKKRAKRLFSAVRTGLEPVTSCVTGRHSNQAELTHLFHQELFIFAVRTGLEPVTSCVTGRHSNQAELTHLKWSFPFCGCKGTHFFLFRQEIFCFFTKKIAATAHHGNQSHHKASL